MSHNTNITRIKAINNVIKKLENEFVFVGGATVSLYVQREAEEVRPTDDIDILVELLSYKDYAALEECFRKIGFTNDTNAKFAGRYILNGIIVDLMPTDESILGFSNKWYKQGFKTAVEIKLDEFQTVKIFEVAYFIASKLEAFKNRGKGDGRTSSDFEDVIFVLNNRNTIWDEFTHSNLDVKKYLQQQFKAYLQNDSFEEWIEAHLGFSSSDSSDYILKNIKLFIAE